MPVCLRQAPVLVDIHILPHSSVVCVSQRSSRFQQFRGSILTHQQAPRCISPAFAEPDATSNCWLHIQILLTKDCYPTALYWTWQESIFLSNDIFAFHSTVKTDNCKTNLYYVIKNRQKAQLSLRDRAMHRVSLNLANYHATTQECRNYLYDKSSPYRCYEVGALVGGNV